MLVTPPSRDATSPGDLVSVTTRSVADDVNLHQGPNGGETISMAVRIDALSTKLEQPKKSKASGQCWRQLFQGAVVVSSHPILRRPDPTYVGLEAALEVMAELGNASFLTEYESIPVLKGFSTFFVATKISEKAIQWHFVRGDPKDYTPYTEITAHATKKFRLKRQARKRTFDETARHFIGWASAINSLPGKLLATPTFYILRLNADSRHAELSV